MKQILAEKPEKREMISKNLIEMVKSCMKKDIINLDLVHTALLQALEISSQKDIEASTHKMGLSIGIGITVQRTDSTTRPY